MIDWFCLGTEMDQWSAKYETRDVCWAPDGKGMVLMDKDKFCCAFEVEDGTT